MAGRKTNTVERLNQLLEQLPSQHVEFAKSKAFEDSLSMKGQACLVTGGASGLGKAFTEALASRGAYVAFLDTNVQNGAAIESELRKQGHSVDFVEADVTSWDSQVAAVKTAIQNAPNGRIGHFVANAGVAGHNLKEHMFPTPIHGQSFDVPPPKPEFTAINVSLIGSYYTLCLASHHFANSNAWAADPQGDRSIVLLGSMSSYRSVPHGTDYAAAKMGMRGLFTSARETLSMSKSPIRVNVLSPQFVETSLNSYARQWYERGGYRFCDINDVVRALLRMIGDQSVRGRSISVNAEYVHDLDDDVSGGDASIQVPDGTHGDRQGGTSLRK